MFLDTIKARIPFVLLIAQTLATNTMAQTKHTNPFFVEYNTPHQTHPFDKIKNEDFLPAMREGMKRQKAEVDSIVANPEKPTFQNTIVALENSGELLNRVQLCFYNLMSAENNEELEKIAVEIAPEETEHSNYISLNEKLFERVKQVYEDCKKANLDVEDRMLLENTYKGFVRSGANLNDTDKEKYREMSKKLSLACLTFGQNVLKATNDFELLITDKSDLSGLPEDVCMAAKERAEAKGKQGWLFDLSYPSYSAFMKFSDRRDLRQKLYMGYNTKAYGGKFDNQEVVKEIVNLRRQIANLLGYKRFADYVLENRMAENPGNVYDLLDKLLDGYKPFAKKEVAELQSFAKENGADFDLQPWDWGFYSRKLKEKKYDINDSIVKPYLELEKVKKAVFGLATSLYGITFRKNSEIPVYHKDVEAFDVYDADGKFLAVLYTDFHPRAGKRNGAWMTEYKMQWMENGVDSRPHISLVMNFSRPVGDKPALLTFDELTTFLHEFGHSLHGMLAKGKYASLSGTNVKRDFVEMPSQLMENWAYEKEFLDGFAVHYQTGEKIPQQIIDNIRASQNFNTGYACLRQLSFGYLDMAWHMQTEEFKGDVAAFERKAWSKAIVLPEVDGTCMSVEFSHIFDGGYAAGYYGYKWAEVLDADVFSVFKEKGIFNRQLAEKFRREVLEKGGSEHPMALYKKFMGRKPKTDALLRRNGIIK